jgi:hypothetical protein
VSGSATADTSASTRIEQAVSVCHEGLATYALHPLPPLDQALSVHPRLEPEDLESDVPPTARTYCEVAGKLAPYPSSPALAVMRTPGWLKYSLDSLVVVESSAPPQLLLMTVAPRAAASFSPAPRSASSALFTSTRIILQLGQAALAMSRSSEISVAHPLSAVGYDPWTPV